MTTEYVQDVGDGDRVRYRFTTERNDVVAFMVQYELVLGDRRYSVVRYDTAHGFAHRDVLDWNGVVIQKEADALPADRPFKVVLEDARCPARSDNQLAALPSSVSPEEAMTETRTSVDQTQMVTRNIELGFDFAQRVLEDPAITDGIRDGVTLILVPDNDPDLAAANIQLGITAIQSGKDVTFRHVRGEEPATDQR